MSLSKLPWVPKNWGGELIVTNNPLYCGKILKFIKGYRLSLHHHLIKQETWFLQSGCLDVYYHDDHEFVERFVKERGIKNVHMCLNKINMRPGDVLEIPQKRIHQAIALEESELIEFSTQHFESDSYRLLKGD